MGWDGSGNFTRTNGTNTGAETWQDDAASSTKILADRHDTHDEDLATGIAACLTKNNESKPTADFLPNTTNSYGLGSSGKQWLNAYAKQFISGSGLATKAYDTLTTAIADIANIVIGDVLILKERTSGNGGGATWDAIDATTVTENEMDIVTGNAAISFQLRNVSVPYTDYNLDINKLGAASSADVGAVINRAIALAKKVYVPAGSYTQTTQIVPLDGTELYGDGESSLITFSGTMAATSSIAVTSKTGVKISDLKLVGDTTADASNDVSGSAIVANGATQLTVEGVHITGFVQYAIQMIVCTHSRIANNFIRNIVPNLASTGGMAGISITAASHAIDVVGNNIKTIGRTDSIAGIGIRIITRDAATPTAIKVRDNYIDTTAIHGMVHYSTLGSPHDTRGSEFIGNIVRNTGMTTGAAFLGSSLYTLNCGGMVINGNSCANSYVNALAGSIVEGAIVCSADSADPVTVTNIISNNYINGANIDGISIQANQVSITGNTINNVTGVAIKCAGDAVTRTNNISITGNTINTCSGSAILLNRVDKISITGNTGSGVGGHGINLLDTNKVTFNSNEFESDGTAGQYAIYAQADFGDNTKFSATGNTLDGFERACNLDDLDNSTIQSNTFGYTGLGVFMKNCNRVSVDNNIFDAPTTTTLLETNTANTDCTFRLNKSQMTTGKSTPNINNAVSGCKVTFEASTDPGSDLNGTWRIGDTQINTTVTAGGTMGSVCTTSGSNGTWKTYGTIAV